MSTVPQALALPRTARTSAAFAHGPHGDPVAMPTGAAMGRLSPLTVETAEAELRLQSALQPQRVWANPLADRLNVHASSSACGERLLGPGARRPQAAHVWCRDSLLIDLDSGLAGSAVLCPRGRDRFVGADRLRGCLGRLKHVPRAATS